MEAVEAVARSQSGQRNLLVFLSSEVYEVALSNLAYSLAKGENTEAVRSKEAL